MQKLTTGNFLTAEDVKEHGEYWKVLTAPVLKEVEYEGKKSKKYEITIRSVKDGETRNWQMNAMTSNYLEDTISKDEKAWIGKKISIEVKDQVIAGTDREVLYAKGAVKKK